MDSGELPMSKVIDFLAKEVKNRRKRAGLTQEEFSEATGISKAQISEIERGIANPGISILEKIAGFFHISVAELLDVDNVLEDHDTLKKIIHENIEHFSTQQLKAMKCLLLIAQEK
jgi:transcriptional regulator with XRE-family HTH domain